MIHAYDKNYLAAAQKNLGCMLDYLVNDVRLPLETVWQHFLISKMSSRFEKGDCSALVGHSGVELAREVLRDAGISQETVQPSYPAERTPEYWTAWALAYFQWQTGLCFREIEAAVPITEVRNLYSPYHEMDIRQFADRMNELYRAAHTETNLKTLRRQAGLSQAELAELSEVPVRTIQEYEQQKKDINKAQAQTVLRLARALQASMEELLEKTI